jgi:hypothetical protein
MSHGLEVPTKVPTVDLLANLGGAEFFQGFESQAAMVRFDPASFAKNFESFPYA